MKRGKLYVILLLVALLGIAVTRCIEPPDAADLPSSVMGHVFNVNGTPISGAIVKCAGLQKATNSKGEYLFDIKPGTYTITASATSQHYITETANVVVNKLNITSNNVNDLFFKLK